MPNAAVGRRVVLAGVAASALFPSAARAASVVDGAGRRVAAPARVARVFPAGPPAAILLYTLAPDLLLGWPRANRADELEYLHPEVGRRPEVGRLTGRGNTANLELVLALRPDLILDSGAVTPTHVELADRVQAQTGIPYALLDGSFRAIPESYRALGALLGRNERAAELAEWCEATVRTMTERASPIPLEGRVRVYYARGPRGLETGLGGSINVETIEFLGAVNVAGEQRGSMATVSFEQVLSWNPAVIVTIDPEFYRNVRDDALWRTLNAVRNGRVHLSPRLPFGWVDFPPSVNRVIGLWWLAKILYPAQFPEDLKSITRDFYARFYHVNLTDRQLDGLLGG